MAHDVTEFLNSVKSNSGTINTTLAQHKAKFHFTTQCILHFQLIFVFQISTSSLSFLTCKPASTAFSSSRTADHMSRPSDTCLPTAVKPRSPISRILFKPSGLLMSPMLYWKYSIHRSTPTTSINGFVLIYRWTISNDINSKITNTTPTGVILSTPWVEIYSKPISTWRGQEKLGDFIKLNKKLFNVGLRRENYSDNLQLLCQRVCRFLLDLH